MRLILAISLVSLLCGLHAADRVLPDQKVNQDTYTCDNIAKVSSAAQSDLTRLKANVEKDIPSYIDSISSARALVQQACQLVDQISLKDSFLQTNSKSSLRATLKKKMADLNTKTENFGNSELESLVQEKINDMNESFDTISSGGSLDEIKRLCGEIDQSIEELISYLNWYKSEVQSQWIDSYLPKRVSEITYYRRRNCVYNLQAGSYEATSSKMKLTLDADKVFRYQDFTENFDKSFEVVPQVAVSIVNYEIPGQEPSIFVEVLSVEKDSFKFRIKCYKRSDIDSFKIHYIAFDDFVYKAQVINTYIDRTVEPKLKNELTDAKFSYPIDISSSLENPKFVVALTGFDFAKNFRDIGITVDVENCKSTYCVYFKIKGTTNRITANILAFSEVNAGLAKDKLEISNLGKNFAYGNMKLKCPTKNYCGWPSLSSITKGYDQKNNLQEEFEITKSTGEYKNFIEYQDSGSELSIKIIVNSWISCNPGK